MSNPRARLFIAEQEAPLYFSAGPQGQTGPKTAKVQSRNADGTHTCTVEENNGGPNAETVWVYRCVSLDGKVLFAPPDYAVGNNGTILTEAPAMNYTPPSP